MKKDIDLDLFYLEEKVAEAEELKAALMYIRTDWMKALLEDLDDVHDRLSAYLCDSTGGLLSYSTYPAQTMITYTEDYYNRVFKDSLEKVLESNELESLISSINDDMLLEEKMKEVKAFFRAWLKKGNEMAYTPNISELEKAYIFHSRAIDDHRYIVKGQEPVTDEEYSAEFYRAIQRQLVIAQLRVLQDVESFFSSEKGEQEGINWGYWSDYEGWSTDPSEPIKEYREKLMKENNIVEY